MSALLPATHLRRRGSARLLSIDPRAGEIADHPLSELESFLRPGDLLVVNDASTLPASLPGTTARGATVEIRLAEAPDGDGQARAVLFGDGDWRTRTEDRPPPPPIEIGERITFASGALTAEVIDRSAISPRLITLLFSGAPDRVSASIFAHGRPVQYAYLAEPLPLWAAQTVYAGRPWAVEPPSAGLMFSWALLLALGSRGVERASITHAAGLSSTGDPTLDARLPLPERYEVPASTAELIRATHARGGRVFAVGTTVVRALESAAIRGGGRVEAGAGRTAMRIGSETVLQVVDGLLTGIHQEGESHFELLGAFAPVGLLHRANEHARAQGYLTHELGDLTLILPRSK